MSIIDTVIGVLIVIVILLPLSAAFYLIILNCRIRKPKGKHGP